MLSRQEMIPQPVFQFRADLRRSPDGDEATIARDIVLSWLTAKSGHPVPPQGWEGKSFVSGDDDQLYRSEAVRYDEFWALRHVQPDEQGRVWRTEVYMGEMADRTLFSAKLVCLRKEGDHRSLPMPTPAFMDELARNVGFVDAGCALTPYHQLVDRSDKTEDLHDLIEDPRRFLPVVVVTARNSAAQNEDLYAVNTYQLADMLFGKAHVYVVSANQTHELSSLLGREWGVYDGAVRLYKPGFDRLKDTIYTHPLKCFDDIRSFSGACGSGAEGFSVYLHDTCMRLGAAHQDDNMPDFRQIKSVASKRAAASSQEVDQDKKIAQLLARIADLEGENKELHELLAYAEENEKALQDQVEDVSRKRNAMLDENASLRDENQKLNTLLKEWRDAAGEAGYPIPKTLNDLAVWSETYLGDKLILTPNTLREAKKLKGADVQKVYRAMILLGREGYERYLSGDQRAMAAFDTAVRENGFTARSRLGKESVVVPGTGEQIPLDHLLIVDNYFKDKPVRLGYGVDRKNRRLVIGEMRSG